MADTTRTVGPIAGDEAGAHPGAELLVTPGAGTERTNQPGLTAAARNTSVSQIHDTGQNPPIEADRLPNGDSDLYFRGFYCSNREVGSKTLMASSISAVCMNRNIWGAEGFEEISVRHGKFAGHRFAHQAAPALERVATFSPAPFMAGMRAGARGDRCA